MALPDTQRDSIKTLMERPIADRCYMLSKKWWDRWKLYINYESETGTKKTSHEHPGRISNQDLMYPPQNNAAAA